MSSAPKLVTSRSGRAPARSTPLASWYTQGTSDGLGDRLLMFDNTSAASLELLRFQPELAEAPGFERALRESVERLFPFNNPAFAQVRAVEFLDGDDGLALVSTHTAGKRLGEMFHARQPRSGMHPAFVTWLIRQLTPAVFALQSHGRGLFHGALTADRIVLTADGHLVIVEHVIGAALDQLRLSEKQLWDDLGIIAIPATDGVARLDEAGDIRQLGLVALSVLLGRRVTPEEYPANLERLLDEFAESAARRSPSIVPPLRLWLERALRLDGRGFESSEDACAGLRELPGPAGRQAFEHLQSSRPRAIAPLSDSPLSEPESAEPEPPEPEVAESLAAESRFNDVASVPDLETVSEQIPTSTPGLAAVAESDAQAGRVFLSYKAEKDPAEKEDEEWMLKQNTADPLERPAASRAAFAVGQFFTVRNLAIAVALVEAVIIGRLATREAPAPVAAAAAAPVPVTIESPVPGDVVLVDGHQVGVTPFELKLGTSVHSIRVLNLERLESPAEGAPAADASPAPVDTAATRAANALALAAARQRSGGLRLVSPIELQVLEGERVLGSSADGPIVTTAGVHQLDLINATLGYRSHQAVEIKAGEIVPLTIKPPEGKLSINALPWAQVWIDGSLVGETPLANLSVPAGEHEILFRHPQLGERRETTIVKSGAASRLSATLSR